MAILYLTHVFSLLPRIWLMSWKGMCGRPGMVLFYVRTELEPWELSWDQSKLKKEKHRDGEFGNYIISNFWSKMKVFNGIWVVGGHRARANKTMISLILVKPQSLPQFVSIFHRCLSYFREDPIFHLPGPQIFHKDSSFAFIFFLMLEETRSF